MKDHGALDDGVPVRRELALLPDDVTRLELVQSAHRGHVLKHVQRHLRERLAVAVQAQTKKQDSS